MIWSMNLGILISGRGSNMKAILNAVWKEKIPARVSVVISNKNDAKGLQIAKRFGVKTEVVESKGIKGANAEYDQKLIKELEKHGVSAENGLVCLAGFMRIMSPEFIEHYKWRVINIHPSLLPSFPGLHAQRQALEYGVKYTGCTVHFVDQGVDTGPIILQGVVGVKDSDTEESLSKRILRKEHKIYPEAVSLFAQKKVTINDKGKVITS